MRQCYGDREVVTLQEDPAPSARATYAEVAERVDRLGRALERLGVEPGDRVGDLRVELPARTSSSTSPSRAWAPCCTRSTSACSRSSSPTSSTTREDRVIFVDDSLVAAARASSRPTSRRVEHYVVMGDGDAGGLPNALRYEELLAEAGAGDFDYPETSTSARPPALCYTSGTTGNPKGVLYSHRSIALHSTARAVWPTRSALSGADRVLPVVPMFHVNAWGLPYAARAGGRRPAAARPLPRRPSRSRELIEAEQRRRSWAASRRSGRPAALRRRARGPTSRQLTSGGLRRRRRAAAADARASRSATACASSRPGG